MSYQHLGSRLVTAAKDHPCIWCREQIKKGEKYLYQTGVYDGDFQANHWHPECHDASDIYFRESGEDSFDPHACKRGSTEETDLCFTKDKK